MRPTAHARAAPSGPAGRWTGSSARTRSCSQSPLRRVGDRDAPSRVVVVPHEHARRLRDDAIVGTDDVLEVEALRPDPRAARRHLDLLARVQLRAEVDLDAREYVRIEPTEDADPSLLQVRRVDGVVDVPHRVAVAEPHALAVRERELGHAAMV